MFQAEVRNSVHAFASKLCYREGSNTTGPLWQGFLCQTPYLQELEQPKTLNVLCFVGRDHFSLAHTGSCKAGVTPATPQSRDTCEVVWFQAQSGFCETFANTGPDLGALSQAMCHSGLVGRLRSQRIWTFKPKLSGNADTQDFDPSPVACSNPYSAGHHGTIRVGVVLKLEHLGLRRNKPTFGSKGQKSSLIFLFLHVTAEESYFVKESWDEPILFWLSGNFTRTFSENYPSFVFAKSWYIGATLGLSSLNSCNSRIYFSFFFFVFFFFPKP